MTVSVVIQKALLQILSDAVIHDDEGEAEENVCCTMYSMICKNMIVAVRPNIESLSDYFLFHVESDGVVTLTEEKTNFGHRYARGTRVLLGYFYDLVSCNKKGSLYRIKGGNEDVLLPVESVLYVGVELSKVGKNFSLNVQDHEDIMCWLAA